MIYTLSRNITIAPREDVVAKTVREIQLSARHDGHGVLAKLMGPRYQERMQRSCMARIAAPIVQSRAFEWTMNVAILVNALCMGFEVEALVQGHDTARTFFLVEQVFLGVFVVEFVLNLMVYTFWYLRTPWGRFDFFFVVVGVASDWVVPALEAAQELPLSALLIFRMVRLVRVARAVRLMPQYRVLWMLVRGLGSALQTLVWAFVMLVAVIFVFAILGMELLHGSDFFTSQEDTAAVIEQHFQTVPKTMLTLLQISTLDSWAVVVRPLVVKQPILMLYFVSFIGLSAIAVMNLVTAIIVENSVSSAKGDREVEAQFQDTVMTKLFAEVENLMITLGESSNGELTKRELQEAYKTNPVVREILDVICNVTEVLDLWEVFDEDSSGGVSMVEFQRGFLKFRSDPPRALARYLQRYVLKFEASVREYLVTLDAWCNSIADLALGQSRLGLDSRRGDKLVDGIRQLCVREMQELQNGQANLASRVGRLEAAVVGKQATC